MKRLIFRRGWFGLLGMVWLTWPAPGQAWERPPVKINTKWEFQVEVKVGPDFRRPTAPWYAYFPVDPRMLPTAQTTPYPSWPAQFPPQNNPAAAPQDAPRPAPTAPLGYNQNAYGLNVQPVGYVPARAPSYWYRNP